MDNKQLQEILKKLPDDAKIIVSLHLTDVYELPASEVGYQPEDNRIVIRQAK